MNLSARPSKSRSILLNLCLVGGLAALLVGMGLVVLVLTMSKSTVASKLSSGRLVSATANSWYLTGHFSEDIATIEAGSTTVQILPDEVTIDGDSVADIDPKVKDVEVRFERGEIDFFADGKVVASRRMGSSKSMWKFR